MELTDEERINLATFSSDYVVNVVYNWYRLNPVERRIVKRYFRKMGKILDIGCGRGRTTVPLKEMGFDIIGIDISRKMIEAAKESYPNIDFRVGNACNLSFEEESFDYVLFSNVGMDYIFPEAKRLIALREIHRVLKRNGLFVFSSNNSMGLWLRPDIRQLLSFTENISRNILKLRSKNYRKTRTSYGYLIVHFVNPIHQIRQLEEIGFKNIEILGNYAYRLTYFEPYIHYVARKATNYG